MDLISIITPIKNGSDLFKSTYISVVRQSYKHFEWFIIDDGSNEIEANKIVEIIDDERVKYIIGKKNLGPGGARNIGLKKTSGKYVTFIDSDDLWDNNFLEKSFEAIKFNNCGIVFSGYRRYLVYQDKYLSDFLPTKQVTYKSILRGSDISCLTSLVDAKYINNDTLFGEIPARNDLVFFYRLLKKTNAFPLQDVLATYRLNKSSVSSNKFRALKYQYLVNRKFGGNSFVMTIINILCWVFYGIKKYRT